MSLKDQVVDFINTPTGKYIAAGAATLLGASAVAALLTKKPEPWPVNGKVFIVTGASSGIGKECAILLAQRGAIVSITARTESLLNKVADECKKHSRVLSIVADVSREEDCLRIVNETAKEFGQLDGLILNAGISMSEPFAEQVDLKAFERLFTVNFYQCLWVCHAALPHLIKSKGRIVNVSSIAGKTYLPNRTAYCSSKNAMIAFFDCLRLEVRDAGIKITTVCPGTVDTDIGSRRVSSDGSIGKRKDTDLDVSKGISAVECARQTIDAMQAGAREIYPNAPINVKLMSMIKILLPEYFDNLIIKATASMTFKGTAKK